MHALYYVGKTCIHYYFLPAKQPAIFRLLAVMHMLGCSVPPGTSYSKAYACFGIYYYHHLVLDIDSDLETDFRCV